LCCLLFSDSGFHKAVKNIHVEDELIKLEADISFDVTVCIKERHDEIEEGEIAQSEDVEILADIMELLEDYQKASELNMTRNI
jgi:hypothetical protein